VKTITSAEFGGLAGEVLAAGRSLQFVACGGSMRPTVRDGDVVTVIPVGRPAALRRGAVVLYRRSDGTAALHRLVRRRRGKPESPVWRARGDAWGERAEDVPEGSVMGVAVSVLPVGAQTGRERRLDTPASRTTGVLRTYLRLPVLALAWCRRRFGG
jgi:hypothetical protein